MTMWLATAGPLSQLPDARDADVDAMLDAEYRLASLFWHGAADSADDGAAAALDEIEIAPWVNIPQEGPGCAVLFGGSGGVFTGMGRRRASRATTSTTPARTPTRRARR